MHPLIPIYELTALSDRELRDLEARLRDIILTHNLPEAVLRNCLASLSNAVFIRSLRETRWPLRNRCAENPPGSSAPAP